MRLLIPENRLVEVRQFVLENCVAADVGQYVQGGAHWFVTNHTPDMVAFKLRFYSEDWKFKC